MLLAKTHEAVKRDMKHLMAAKGKKHQDELTKATALATVKQAAKEVAVAQR
jgi:hypothetical protein